MVELAGASVVAILTRAPSAGGKSRLFAELGRSADPDLLSALLLDTLDAAIASGVTPLIAVEPASACAEVSALVPGVRVIPQQPGTLGDRMAAAIAFALDRGARAVALIGSDLPDLPPSAVADTFAVLQSDPARVVLGPADDGGYYLIGATRVPPLFAGVQWSTADVLAQTLQLADQHRVQTHLLMRARDVDTVDDLRRTTGRRTAAWVRRTLLRG